MSHATTNHRRTTTITLLVTVLVSGMLGGVAWVARSRAKPPQRVHARQHLTPTTEPYHKYIYEMPTPVRDRIREDFRVHPTLAHAALPEPDPTGIRVSVFDDEVRFFIDGWSESSIGQRSVGLTVTCDQATKSTAGLTVVPRGQGPYRFTLRWLRDGKPLGSTSFTLTLSGSGEPSLDWDGDP